MSKSLEYQKLQESIQIKPLKYIILKDKKDWNSAKDAIKDHPGFRLPTRSEFDEFIKLNGGSTNAGMNIDLPSATYWSSTEYDSNNAYAMNFKSTGVSVRAYPKKSELKIILISHEDKDHEAH